MGYRTVDELEGFSFHDAHISGIEVKNGHFFIILDGVIIKSDNSCNRDIRDMCTNDLILKIQDADIIEVVEEGYKVYNADGKLMEQYEDRVIGKEYYSEIFCELCDEAGESYIYTIEKSGEVYTFNIDASDGTTYIIKVKGTHNVEEWERFNCINV